MSIQSQSTYFDPKVGEFIFRHEKEDELKIIFFKSNVDILSDERPAIISWEVQNASEVLINKISVSLKGSMLFHSLEPQIIKLIAKNKTKQFLERSLFVGIDKIPPIIAYFKSDKASVIRNSAVTLSWNVTGAKKVTIDNGIGDVTGQSELIIAVRDSEVYKLTARNYFDYETSAYLSFNVFPSQVIQSLIIPIPEFNIQGISSHEPTFNLHANVNANIEVTQPVFTNLIEFTQLDIPNTKILLKKTMINSVLFPNNVFKWLIKRQKEVNHIIKLLWKTNMKEKLKSFKG